MSIKSQHNEISNISYEELKIIQGIDLSEIYPELTPELARKYLEMFFPNMIKVNPLPKKLNSLEDLPADIIELFRHIFITQSNHQREAMKTLFYHGFQFMAESKNYDLYLPQDKDFIEKEKSNDITGKPDFILKPNRSKEASGAKNPIWVYVLEYLDQFKFTQLQTALNSLSISSLEVPNKVLFICNKLNRNFAIGTSHINISSNSVPISYYIFYHDDDLPYKRTDWIVYKDIRIRAFNFPTIESIITVFQRLIGAGEIKIEAETMSGNRKVIWKGLFYPKALFSK